MKIIYTISIIFGLLLTFFGIFNEDTLSVVFGGAVFTAFGVSMLFYSNY
ncbi:MAG: hypothetical protein H6779_04760 [Candidatus Nomurabacteria bacterium]|nr:MAG: hypothetical protein H6779_04760 [Candidatus Nomurabacteria bacterium]